MALERNEVLPEKLYIFQDGMKEDTDIEEWRKVSEIIKKVSFCDTEIHIAEKNKGLSRSITDGVGYVLEIYDAVIVLEDDCVPDKQFMRFMVSALQTYQRTEKVYSVSGYAWSINLCANGEDAYFNGRCCSYGWGTWRDRWDQYENDYYVLKRIKKDPDASRRLMVWGKDLEAMLIGNLTGKNDSWAVFWALKIIEKGGYCLSSYRQLIHNIGFDGTGTHSGFMKDDYQYTEELYHREFRFPVNVHSTKECEEEFSFLFGGIYGAEKTEKYKNLLLKWIHMKQIGRNIQIPKGATEGIAVWGKGIIFDRFIEEVNIPIKYIIESKPSGNMYKKIPIKSINELQDDIKCIIVIPFFDISIIKKKLERMKKNICVIGIDELIDEN